MKRHLLLTTVSVLAIPFVVLTGSVPANAAGCGGYVNIMQWGCAPWDNNPPKKGVTPGYPAVTPKVTVQPPASVISNDGGSLVKTGAPVVSNDGGSVVSNDGGSAVAKNNAGLVSNAGGTFVGNNGSAVLQKPGNGLVSDNGLGLVATGGGNAISDNGAGLLGQDGSSLARNGAALLGQDGSSLVRNGSGLLGQDGSSLISQDGAGLNLKGPTAYKAVAPADAPKQAAVQPAPGPTQLQIDTANAAAAVAAKDAAAAKAANDAISGIAVGANRPTDPVKLKDDNEKLAAAALVSAKANLSKAQSDLVTMSKNGASAYDIKGQQDLIAKAQTNLNFQTVMTTKDASGNDYVSKAIAVDTSRADLATAKSVVDGLTKAFGSDRPSDPQKLAIVNSAMAVQALAQDRADMAVADAAATRLAASGASKSDIQTQTDLVATKQKDIANILKVNPQVAAAVGTAANASPDAVNKAISGLVAAAKTQTALAVQLTDTQVQAALAAVQQLKAGTYSIKSLDAPAGAAASTAPSGPVAAVTSPATNAAAVTSPVVAAVQAPVVNQSELTPAVVQMLVQSGPATIQAMQSAQQAALAKGDTALADGLGKNIVNLQAQVAAAKAMPPAATVTAVAATTAATAQPVVTTQAPPVVDKSELTPAVVQMLVQSGPATIQAMQSAQQAALAKGDKALADGLGKDIVNLQAQVAAAKAMPPVETAKTVAATTAATTAPAVGAVSAVKPASSPAVVANASPPVTSPAGASATTAAKPSETSAPAKISDDQSKAVHQALRTIPGDLTKAEQKSFSALSAMVDRAATKGLTAEEATYLKEGIEALAQKHPKAEKQNGLTRIANTVATQKPAVATAAPVGTAATPPGTAAAPAASAMPSVAQPAQSRAPEQVMSKPEAPKSASATPAITVQPATPKTEMRNEPRPAVASTTPAAISAPTPAKPAPAHEMHIEPHPAVASRPVPAATPVARVEPAKMATPAVRAAPPAVAAPRPPAVAAAKPPAPPAARPQSCSPNIVNGKMMGMTCH